MEVPVAGDGPYFWYEECASGCDWAEGKARKFSIETAPLGRLGVGAGGEDGLVVFVIQSNRSGVSSRSLVEDERYGEDSEPVGAGTFDGLGWRRDGLVL